MVKQKTEMRSSQFQEKNIQMLNEYKAEREKKKPP